MATILSSLLCLHHPVAKTAFTVRGWEKKSDLLGVVNHVRSSHSANVFLPIPPYSQLHCACVSHLFYTVDRKLLNLNKLNMFLIFISMQQPGICVHTYSRKCGEAFYSLFLFCSHSKLVWFADNFLNTEHRCNLASLMPQLSSQLSI